MNKEELAEENGLEMEELEILIDIFQESARTHRESLKTAIAANDRELMKQNFHKLAGSSAGLLGMGEINRVSREAEAALRAGKEIDAAAIVEKIEEILSSEGLT